MSLGVEPVYVTFFFSAQRERNNIQTQPKGIKTNRRKQHYRTEERQSTRERRSKRKKVKKESELERKN